MLEYLQFKEPDKKNYRERVRQEHRNFDPYPYHLHIETLSPTWSFSSEYTEEWIPFYG
jgi:hypothetical protein